jgi:hypothetical protein
MWRVCTVPATLCLLSAQPQQQHRVQTTQMLLLTQRGAAAPLPPREPHARPHAPTACRQTALRLPQCAGQTAAGAHQQLVHAMQVRHGSDCHQIGARQTVRACTLGWAEFWCLAASSHMLPARLWRKLCNTCWWPMTLPSIVNAATGLVCLTAGRLRLVLTCWRVCTGPATLCLLSAQPQHQHRAQTTQPLSLAQRGAAAPLPPREAHARPHAPTACRQMALRLPQCAGQTAAGAYQQLVHAMQVRHACAGSDCHQKGARIVARNVGSGCL